MDFIDGILGILADLDIEADKLAGDTAHNLVVAEDMEQRIPVVAVDKRPPGILVVAVAEDSLAVVPRGTFAAGLAAELDTSLEPVGVDTWLERIAEAGKLAPAHNCNFAAELAFAVQGRWI